MQDDPTSWDESFNSPGPESKTPGSGETLQNNPERLKKGAAGGNRFSVVEADGDDLIHSDGKTAAKAVKLIHHYKNLNKPFFLFSLPLVKKLTVIGIIGKTHGVNKATKPPKNAKKNIPQPEFFDTPSEFSEKNASLKGMFNVVISDTKRSPFELIP